MILAGIDEAGYGPLLGPLVTASAALRLPGLATQPIPDLWKPLSPSVSRTRDRNNRKLHIADSKAVYSPSVGVANLERGVLAFAAASGLPIDSLDTLLSTLDPAAPAHLSRHPWYATPSPFPLVTSAASLAPTANGLRSSLTSAGISTIPTTLAARVIPEGRYNDLVVQTRNKASVLFMHVAQLIQSLLTAHAAEPGGLLLICDRQGGRDHYGEPLRTMFPDHHLTILEESPGVSTYQLSRNTALAVISFREKGETLSLPTALASMVCKYLRESLMHRFNLYFQSHQPTLQPTAGYYTDGQRFLVDTEELRATLAIPDRELIRAR